MKMKKAAAVLLAAMMTVSMLAGCGNNTETTTEEAKQESDSEPVDVNVMALKGPTAMGMVKMMDESDKGEIDT